jgi:hypothetical protein
MQYRYVFLWLVVASLFPGCANLESAAIKQLDRISSGRDPGSVYSSNN